jgi:hypothetical protein
MTIGCTAALLVTTHDSGDMVVEDRSRARFDRAMPQASASRATTDVPAARILLESR